MKRFHRPICAFALAISMATATAQAQPDPNVQPKGDNTVNRPVGGPGAATDTVRQRLEAPVRTRLTASGFADPDLQNAVIAHMTSQIEARQPVTQKAALIQQALRNDATTDAELGALVNDYQAAVEDFETNRDKADQALDDKLGYSKNLRLRAALLVLGAIGHMPSQLMAGGMGRGGMGGGANGMRPRRPRNNGFGGDNGGQPNAPNFGAPPAGGAAPNGGGQPNPPPAPPAN